MDTTTAVISVQSFPLNATRRTARTARDILGEAARLPSHSRHVDAPQPPVVLRVQGQQRGPDYVLALLEERVLRARDSRGRRIRKDAHLLVAGVASYPGTHEEVELDPARYKAWGAATLKFLHAEYGEHLISAVLHKDETRPHVHFYLVPAESDFTAGAIHPGQAAARPFTKAQVRERQSAYRAAMTAFLDRYYAAVAHLGLTRTGGTPRKTLPRAQHLARVEREEICARKSQIREQEERAQVLAAEIARLKDEKIALEKSIRDRALELGTGISEADRAHARACGITI